MIVDARSVGLEPHHHILQFYRREDELCRGAGDYLGASLRAGETAVVMATERHRVDFAAAMKAQGVDMKAAGARLVTVDAAETLAAVMIGDWPDATRFHDVVGGLICVGAQTGTPVRAYGDMAALLWETGNVAAAIELEKLWNVLRSQLPFSLFCGYPAFGADRNAEDDAVEEICRLHSAVVGIRAHPSVTRHAVSSSSEAIQAFDDTPDASGAARRFVVATLDKWGCAPLAPDVTQVVAELTANAIVHARSGFTVELTERAGTLRVSVYDESGVPPLRRDSSSLADSGRGLAVVGALAAGWGVELYGDSKVVWAEFPT